MSSLRTLNILSTALLIAYGQRRPLSVGGHMQATMLVPQLVKTVCKLCCTQATGVSCAAGGRCPEPRVALGCHRHGMSVR